MSDPIIIVPLGNELLAFTRAELDAARVRARDLGLGTGNGAQHVEPLVDSARMAEIAGVPQSWIEEAARQKRIPSIDCGKYKRYRATDVIAALTTTTASGVTRDQHSNSGERRRARKT